MTDNDRYAGSAGLPFLSAVEDAEKLFLASGRNRGADLESAVRLFLEFLKGFEALDLLATRAGSPARRLGFD